MPLPGSCGSSFFHTASIPRSPRSRSLTDIAAGQLKSERPASATWHHINALLREQIVAQVAADSIASRWWCGNSAGELLQDPENEALIALPDYKQRARVLRAGVLFPSCTLLDPLQFPTCKPWTPPNTAHQSPLFTLPPRTYLQIWQLPRATSRSSSVRLLIPPLALAKYDRILRHAPDCPAAVPRLL